MNTLLEGKRQCELKAKIPYEKFLLDIPLYHVAQFLEMVEKWETNTGNKREDAVCSQSGNILVISMPENQKPRKK